MSTFRVVTCFPHSPRAVRLLFGEIWGGGTPPAVNWGSTVAAFRRVLWQFNPTVVRSVLARVVARRV